MLAVETNTAGLVFLIALEMVLIISAIEGKRRELWRTNGIILALLLLIVSAGMKAFDSYQLAHSEMKSEYVNGEKVLWTLFVGSNVKTQGKWSQEDVVIYDSWEENSDFDEIHEYRVRLVTERYDYLLDHPDEMFTLVQAKLKSIWAVFSYSISFTNETITNEVVAKYYQQFISRLFLLIEYGVSLVAVWWCLYDNIKHRSEIYL